MTDNAHFLAELSRRFECLLAFGTIAEVDNGAVPPQVRLDIAGRLTGWMPVPAQIGRNFVGWSPLRVGTQVLAGCVSGDPAQAVILQILYTTAGARPIPPPEQGPDVDVIVWADGTTIRYDSAAQRMRIFSAGDLILEADGTLVTEAGNIVSRVRENGTLHTDHAGKATAVTHKGGAQFDSESWVAGAVVTDRGDNGFSPPRVDSPVESV